jgi:hypothetical protein
LLARGQREKAIRVLSHHHSNDKEDDPLVLFELDEIESALARERINKQGFSSFLRTKGALPERRRSCFWMNDQVCT